MEAAQAIIKHLKGEVALRDSQIRQDSENMWQAAIIADKQIEIVNELNSEIKDLECEIKSWSVEVETLKQNALDICSRCEGSGDSGPNQSCFACTGKGVQSKDQTIADLAAEIERLESKLSCMEKIS